jgi:solute carrier family 25 (mitochondrial carnitine/acylcarnitine transporter), member 20/29
VTTLDGSEIEIDVQPKKTTISDAKLVEPDIYAANGVLHTVDALLLPPGALEITPEKYLLALNCTSFVSLLHSVNLTGFINKTEPEWTILAPRDDVLSMFAAMDGDLPEKGSDALKRMLQYHFLPGRWVRSKLKDGILLKTALEEPGLAGGKQVMDIEVIESDKDGKRDQVDWRVRFGGASVVGDPGMMVFPVSFVTRSFSPSFSGSQ